MNELWDKARTAKHIAEQSLRGIDVHGCELLAKASVIGNSRTREPSAICFTNPITGKNIFIDLDPDRVRRSSTDEIAGWFKAWMQQAIERGDLPSDVQGKVKRAIGAAVRQLNEQGRPLSSGLLLMENVVLEGQEPQYITVSYHGEDYAFDVGRLKDSSDEQIVGELIAWLRNILDTEQSEEA